MNRQMKTGRGSFGNSGCFPVPITLSADDLFHDPSEESELMQGSVGGDAELTLSSSHEHDSNVDVLAAFPRPTSHIHQWPSAGELVSPGDTNHSYLPSLHVAVMSCCIRS